MRTVNNYYAKLFNPCASIKSYK